MTQEMMINFAIGQIGEEKAKEVVDMLLTLTEKMSEKQMYIVKKIPNKGICLISTNSNVCNVKFSEKPSSVIELEKIVREIEF